MTNTIYLVCGVPGSGKTWVCEQLRDKFQYLAHDAHMKGFRQAVNHMAPLAEKPLLSECPFGERVVKENLEADGMQVIPLFIVEELDVICERYMIRDKRGIPRQHVTRALGLKARAEDWGAFYGTSQEVLDHLRSL